MLTAEGCRSRQGRLWEKVKAEVEVILIAAPWHVHYLTGHYVSPNTLNVPCTRFLVLERGGAAWLFLDNWAAREAQHAHVDEIVVYEWYDGRRPGSDRHAGVVGILASWLLERRPRRVAVEPAHLPWGIAEALRESGATVVDVTPVLQAMRLRKDPDELAAIRFAVQVAVAGHAAARAAVQPEVTELDVYAAVHAATVKAAGGVVTMLGDFASGGRSGGPPSDRILQPGDLMIVDFFPIVNGYRADITNTYAVGQPTDAQRRHMDLLLRAKAAGESMLRPGVAGGQVYAAVRGVFEEAGIAGHFPHHAGHALGLMHPEPPFFVPESQELLQEGQVVTLEPGLYDPAVGGMRIEDNYLITADGFERLSNHVKGFS